MYVVGEEGDLLVMLIALHSTDIENISLCQPERGNVSQSIYNPPLTADKTVSDHILFLHAMSDGDTTSALFNQGIVKLIDVV